MIQKIVCPTDFSSTSTNATEYAANLAKRMNASLTLLHVQPLNIGEGINLFSLGERESVKEAKVAADMLEKICTETRTEFNISCNYEIISSLSSFEKTVEEESHNYDLTVIGTNGADSAFQFYFGSHSFRIAKHAYSPVLIVPEVCGYSDIRKVMFASDYNKEDNLSLHELKEITDIFKPHLQVVHIREKNTTLSPEVYSLFCNATQDILSSNPEITFDTIIHENEKNFLEALVIKSQPDLLALYFEEHGFIYHLFHKSIIEDEDLTSAIEIPILIFHN